jgi:glucose-6-phosphate 1-epimerase
MSHTLIVIPGPNGQPKLLLEGPGGSRAEVFLHGAHVTSWIPSDGRERLFLSETAEFAPGKAIRGGIPVIFPQFAGEGPLPKHGFARTLPWEALECDAYCARLRLVDGETTWAIWPHAFAAELKVELEQDQLRVSLEITNSGQTPITFTSALHSYLRVEDITRVTVGDLKGLRLRDSAQENTEGVETESEIRFAGEVDRIYFDAPSQVQMKEDETTLRIQSQGFPDTVIWNPGHTVGAKLRDLEPEGYRRFVCVETAVIGKPVTLKPEEHWVGTQVLIAG